MRGKGFVMCIPCVMCGACMDGEGMQGVEEGRCPSCGEIVPPDAISCPHCYTFLYRKPAQQDQQEQDSDTEAVASNRSQE